MSAPQAFRLAIEACRPIRVRFHAQPHTSASRIRPFLHTRPFSHDRRLRKDDKSTEITEGFPMPEAEFEDKEKPFEENQAPEDLSDAPTEAIPGANAEAPANAMPGIAPETHQIDDMVAGREPVEAAAPPPPPADPTPHTTTTSTSAFTPEAPPEEPTETSEQPTMFPPNVLATHMAPMRHQPEHGIPVGSLQLRSYSLRNLEFFADFCMRAAFYMKMPARGPVPLPRRTERWTTIRSNFVHKKSQENFERITYKRLITVMDADKSAVETWLAFVRRWQFYGVGMKANVWSYESLDVAKEMDATYEKEISQELEGKLSLFGWNEEMGKLSSVERLLKHSAKTMNTIGSPMMDVRERSQSGSIRPKALGVMDVDEKSPTRTDNQQKVA